MRAATIGLAMAVGRVYADGFDAAEFLRNLVVFSVAMFLPTALLE
jgi:hypothetical protein